MKDYDIVPEFCYSKFFPFLMTVYQFVAMSFILFALHIDPLWSLLAGIFQLCSIYYGGLLLYSKFYKISISANTITIQNIIKKSKSSSVDNLRWKIIRFPWYNSYFILLFQSKRLPIAVVKPHWKNALRILKLSHLGKLSTVELDYLKFLKNVGLL